MKKIEIMGCGYIGLPTAITFTLAGYEVCGFDVKEEVVQKLNAGHIHIVEPGLQDAMTKALATGRLHFTDKPEPADVFIICVQTPYRDTPEGKRVSEMKFVESAARSVGTVLRAGGLCVLESTSPPYSTRLVESIVSEVSGLKPSEFMSWSSTRSWTSSTVTVWPASMHSSVTLREANLISRSVRRSSSGTSWLALRMALAIFSTSKVTSDPLRLMIFMTVPLL